MTFPMSIREKLRSVTALSSMAKAVTAMLRKLGFQRGLRRWHFFGDETTTFNPHLNFLLDSGRLSKVVLAYIKREIYELVGENCVVHYQYTSIAAKKFHMLKYVTRPTFLQRQWDEALSYDLKGLRNSWAWGKWDTPFVWDVEPKENTLSPESQAVLAGICPTCSGQLSWTRTVVRSSYLVTAGLHQGDARIGLFPIPPSREEWALLPSADHPLI